MLTLSNAFFAFFYSAAGPAPTITSDEILVCNPIGPKIYNIAKPVFYVANTNSRIRSSAQTHLQHMFAASRFICLRTSKLFLVIWNRLCRLSIAHFRMAHDETPPALLSRLSVVKPIALTPDCSASNQISVRFRCMFPDPDAPGILPPFSFRSRDQRFIPFKPMACIPESSDLPPDDGSCRVLNKLWDSTPVEGYVVAGLSRFDQIVPLALSREHLEYFARLDHETDLNVDLNYEHTVVHGFDEGCESDADDEPHSPVTPWPTPTPVPGPHSVHRRSHTGGQINI